MDRARRCQSSEDMGSERRLRRASGDETLGRPGGLTGGLPGGFRFSLCRNGLRLETMQSRQRASLEGEVAQGFKVGSVSS